MLPGMLFVALYQVAAYTFLASMVMHCYTDVTTPEPIHHLTVGGQRATYHD